MCVSVSACLPVEVHEHEHIGDWKHVPDESQSDVGRDHVVVVRIEELKLSKHMPLTRLKARAPVW